MKKSLCKYFAQAMCVFLCGCDVNLGPPLPEVYAEKALRAAAIDEETIQAVISGQSIAPDKLDLLLGSSDASVRHMVARNPYLGRQERSEFIKDIDGFVRSGLALNTSVSPEEVEVLLRDEDGRVKNALAINPAVSAEALLILRERERVDLIYFAQNPSCPLTIQQEIEKSRRRIVKDLWANTKERGGRGGYPYKSDVVTSPDSRIE